MKPFLIVFSGLPGTGKTTLSKLVAQDIKAAYFRLDTIEHGLSEICKIKVAGEGYRLTYRIVKDNLENGMNVIADCCNPINLTRNEWEQVAISSKSLLVNVEILCSNIEQHKTRVENRSCDIKGFTYPSWNDVQNRTYEKWEKEVIQIDTASKTIEACRSELLIKIKEFGLLV